MIIFSMIAKLTSRLSCNGLGKINDYEYILIWINKMDSKNLIHFSCLFTYFTALIISLIEIIICLVYLISKKPIFIKLD